jgi:hypothetical protein
MQVHRTYGNSGNLTSYTISPTANNRKVITNQMSNRGKRYYKQSKINQLTQSIKSIATTTAIAVATLSPAIITALITY